MILALLLTFLVVIGGLIVASYLLETWLLETAPPLPPMRAWQLSNDYCRFPMARPLDPETLEPVGDWRLMTRFTGMMMVKNGVLFARDYFKEIQ